MPGNEWYLLTNRTETYIYWAHGMYQILCFEKLFFLSSETVMILILHIKKVK